MYKYLNTHVKCSLGYRINLAHEETKSVSNMQQNLSQFNLNYELNNAWKRDTVVHKACYSHVLIYVNMYIPARITN